MDNSGVSNDCRIYVDCTDTVVIGLNTGIQRVVRNIVARSEKVGSEIGIPIIPVVMFNGDFWPLNIIPIFPSYRKIVSGFYERGGRFYENFKSDFSLKNPTHSEERLETLFSKKKDLMKILLRRISRSFFFFPLWGLPILRGKSKILFSKEDIILLPDAFWVDSNLFKALEKLKKKGSMILPVIHDLIPLTHPQFNSEFYNSKFVDCFYELMNLSEGAITISKAGKADLTSAIARILLKSGNPFPVEYFYHGSDLEKDMDPDLTVRSSIVSLISEKRLYLSVGTIEPRKGYETILDAFSQLWQKEVNISLCIIGKVGGASDKIIKKIYNNAYLNKHLFVFHDINDAELVYLYKNSKSLIFASAVEGFGLPLVEAMHFDLPVIASDIPIFREIGRDYPTYFRVGVVEDLLGILLNFEDSVLRRHSSSKWLTWDESIEMLFKKILILKSVLQNLRREEKNII